MFYVNIKVECILYPSWNTVCQILFKFPGEWRSFGWFTGLFPITENVRSLPKILSVQSSVPNAVCSFFYCTCAIIVIYIEYVLFATSLKNIFKSTYMYSSLVYRIGVGRAICDTRLLKPRLARSTILYFLLVLVH